MRVTRGGAAVAVAMACWAGAAQAHGGGGRGHGHGHGVTQPELTTRAVPIIAVDGLRFRDLDRDGKLTPYEDWRRPAQQRAADLAGRLSLEQKAGLMVHGTLPVAGTGYDAAKLTPLVADRHLSTFITRLSAEPAQIAAAGNAVQALAEEQPFGIPAVISTDPRNGFSVAQGQTVPRVGTTAMPDTTGMAAAGDPRLTRKLGDVIRQEYRALGISEGLSPQADIATEPRWTRINGTFGSDPRTARDQVNAYVSGLQGGARGIGDGSVAAVTKHWVGYGAQVNGYDSHYYYGRYAAFPGGDFADHLIPFTGAFAADTAGIMPTYSILQDLVHQGHQVPQVGAGFNSYLLQDLLRGKYGFDGVITSDWGITGDCPQICRDNKPPASFIGAWGVGMPWGYEDSTVLDRTAAAINAGVDVIGGSDDPSPIVTAVGQVLITPQRVDASAQRVLTQKFQLGLFEHPFVDEAAAGQIAGNATFAKLGDAAQARSLTLLKNARRTLPLRRRAVTKVYAYGVAPDAVTAAGLTPVDDPKAADVAIVRLNDPRAGSDLTGLKWTGAEADIQAFDAAVASGTPTVAVPKLDRPLILTDVTKSAAAILANYGVSDAVLLDTLLGRRAPGGHLPFELPSSEDAVAAQQGDVPDDSAQPLFRRGFGLSYRGGWSHHRR